MISISRIILATMSTGILSIVFVMTSVIAIAIMIVVIRNIFMVKIFILI